jgi:hypothetical protein
MFGMLDYRAYKLFWPLTFPKPKPAGQPGRDFRTALRVSRRIQSLTDATPSRSYHLLVRLLRLAKRDGAHSRDIWHSTTAGQ